MKYHVWLENKETGETTLLMLADSVEEIEIDVDILKNCKIRITYEEEE